jgi:hypothetical protein
MLILAAFATIALLVAGSFAVIKGDTFLFVSLIVVLGLAILVGVPHVLAFQAQFQHAIDAAFPIALR